jgi:hypothetical protein
MRSPDRFPRDQWYYGIGFRSLNATVEAESALSLEPRDPIGDFRLEYLDEYEAIYETASDRESEP